MEESYVQILGKPRQFGVIVDSQPEMKPAFHTDMTKLITILHNQALFRYAKPRFACKDKNGETIILPNWCTIPNEIPLNKNQKHKLMSKSEFQEIINETVHIYQILGFNNCAIFAILLLAVTTYTLHGQNSNWNFEIPKNFKPNITQTVCLLEFWLSQIGQPLYTNINYTYTDVVSYLDNGWLVSVTLRAGASIKYKNYNQSRIIDASHQIVLIKIENNILILDSNGIGYISKNELTDIINMSKTNEILIGVPLSMLTINALPQRFYQALSENAPNTTIYNVTTDTVEPPHVYDYLEKDERLVVNNISLNSNTPPAQLINAIMQSYIQLKNNNAYLIGTPTSPTTANVQSAHDTQQLEIQKTFETEFKLLPELDFDINDDTIDTYDYEL